MTTMPEMMDWRWQALSGLILDYEIKENLGRIDTGIYSKGWEIIFVAGVNNTTTIRIKAGNKWF